MDFLSCIYRAVRPTFGFHSFEEKKNGENGALNREKKIIMPNDYSIALALHIIEI